MKNKTSIFKLIAPFLLAKVSVPFKHRVLTNRLSSFFITFLYCWFYFFFLENESLITPDLCIVATCNPYYYSLHIKIIVVREN